MNKARPADHEALRILGTGIKVIEVGVYRALHAEAMLQLLMPKLFVAIDYWDYIEGDVFQRPEQHDAALIESWCHLRNKKEVLIIKGLSIEIAKVLIGGFDYIYVDGGHMPENVKLDLTVWYPKLRSGGLFAGHDYTTNIENDTVCGVKRAVDEIFGDKAKHSEGAYADWWVWKE